MFHKTETIMSPRIALSLTLAVLTLTPPSLAANPIAINGTISYYMTSANTGDDVYLRCGSDLKCSMASAADTPPTTGDAYSVIELQDKTYRLFSNFGKWNLDVDPSTLHIQANAQNSSSFAGESWKLLSWPDGTYALSNSGHSGVLDVQNSQTPFINPTTSASLMGQHWSFKTALAQATDTTTAPGTTVMATTTAVSTLSTALVSAILATSAEATTAPGTTAAAGTPSSSSSASSASASATQSTTSGGSKNRMSGAVAVGFASLGIFVAVLAC
jgi:hypothetical protein